VAAATGTFRGPNDRHPVAHIIGAYDSFVVRAYCIVRFRIIRGRFLEELGQFLPRDGRVMEVGCGFGLFALYFASTCPDLTLHGVDVDKKRIQLASRARERLGLTNVSFDYGDANDADLDESIDAGYVLDLLHHLRRDSARALIQRFFERLPPGGTLIIKDIATRPRYKMAFTWLLDYLMTGGERPEYWSTTDLTRELRVLGFSVIRHAMTDLLPYPHVLYVCVKPTA
jgi:cyclopropane fatty-acyl-phospholipid synthase-like methyltransferase